MSTALNPITLPLTGRQVIEASAGTGKTWTLAALYVRLVLGHGRGGEALLPPQILVMTFTDAATAELRARIRQRLRDAAVFFDTQARDKPLPQGLEADDFLYQLRDSFEPQRWPACALQLSHAADWMDDAAIYTIHAWSRRMLSQHALDSHNLFEQTRLDQATQLQLSLVQDYWRTWYYPQTTQALQHVMAAVGATPDQLLDKIKLVWRDQERKPRLVSAPNSDPTQAIGIHAQWHAQSVASANTARALWDDGVHQALAQARAQGKIRGSGISDKNFANWLTALAQWATKQTDVDIKALERFTPAWLKSKGWEDCQQHHFFTAMAAHVDGLKQEPDLQQLLVQHAAHSIGQAYQQAKAQRAAFDFSDLLQHLYHGVMAADGRLADAIRLQYPVALVDEFQDTDPWQYGSLDRIYNPQDSTPANAWVMIGDPKQAIYSFRGADLGTYLQARRDALWQDPDALHTLSGNHRSCQALVNAINHVFTRIDTPFSEPSTPPESVIAYVPVTANSKELPLTLHNQTHQVGMTVWHLQGEAGSVNASLHLSHMSAVFADQMALMLNQGDATPGQMAVLVRGLPQALAMRAALRQRGIPSVYLSDQSSVYQSLEAMDMWRLLRAVASPRNTRWMRAALASRVWGLSLDEVLARTQDERWMEDLFEQFTHWQQLWLKQGVLPMLHQCLHSQGIAQRLLADPDGERRLSNFLHLGELLQQASQSLQGIHALVRHLGQQIQNKQEASESQKSRLETDSQCVQVFTYHKSKGLQYPLVFVPFAGSFTTGKSSHNKGGEEDDESHEEAPSSTEEDMRLLYVALTRAQRAIWLGVAETAQDVSGDLKKGTLKRSALSKLLNRSVRGDLSQQLHALWGDCQDIALHPLPRDQNLRYQPPHSESAIKDALSPQRRHHSLWWTASFSAMTRNLVTESPSDEAHADATTDATTVASDIGEAEPSPHDSTSRWQKFPAGARYGVLLHDVLEWQSQNQWPLAQPEPPDWLTQEWDALLVRKARWLNLPAAAQTLLQPWLKALLTQPLPLEGLNSADLVLGKIPRDALWPEMTFHLQAHGLSASSLDQQIQAYLMPNVQRPILQERTLQGMLTGSLDLVVAHAGRYFVLDYKSNHLKRYDAASLQDAVLKKRYEVQYVLYTLALHRLLKVRLKGYDYDHHMGGAVYLFLRGIDDPGSGVHAMRPARALIEALDKAFAGVQP